MKGRKAAFINGIEQYNFSKLASSHGGARERRRFLAFAHLQDGKTFSESARMVKVTPHTVQVWVNKFRKQGIEGLREKPGRGRRASFPQEKDEELCQAVKELQAKRNGGRIRGKDIMDLIEKIQGVRPSKSSLYRILERAKLVWITGRSQHAKANPKDQEAFKKTL